MYRLRPLLEAPELGKLFHKTCKFLPAGFLHVSSSTARLARKLLIPDQIQLPDGPYWQGYPVAYWRLARESGRGRSFFSRTEY
jgi:hypothetical protein